MDWDLEDRLLSVGRTILDLVAAAEARRRRFRVRESEARVIREIAERILAGESSSSIVRDLNARKVPTRGASTARRRQAIQVVGTRGTPVCGSCAARFSVRLPGRR
jgi:hypothetical protein